MKKTASIVIFALILSLVTLAFTTVSFAAEDYDAVGMFEGAELDTTSEEPDASDEGENEYDDETPDIDIAYQEKESVFTQEMKDAMLVIIAAAIAAIPTGIGSILGVRMGGIAAAGVTSEKPELFGKLLVLQALPGTQGIYGFLTAVLILVNSGLLGGALTIEPGAGWKYIIASLPIAVVGLISAIYQAKVGVAGIHMTSKVPETSGKGVTMAALVETYAILALLVSILLIFFAC